MDRNKIPLNTLTTVAGAWQIIYPAYCQDFLWSCATFQEFRNLVSERFILDDAQWAHIHALWGQFHPKLTA